MSTIPRATRIKTIELDEDEHRVFEAAGLLGLFKAMGKHRGRICTALLRRGQQGRPGISLLARSDDPNAWPRSGRIEVCEGVEAFPKDLLRRAQAGDWTDSIVQDFVVDYDITGKNDDFDYYKATVHRATPYRAPAWQHQLEKAFSPRTR